MTAVSGSGLLLLLCLLSAAECDLDVLGTVGNDVTLPLKYDARANGLSCICWGRGVVPSSGCGNQLLATDGLRVKKDSLVSSRYQLLGNLRKGDVSLTILNVSEMDSGRYGCRVGREGWFNDDKYHFTLRVQKDTKPTPKWKLDDVTSTEQTILKYTQVTEARKETGSDEAMDYTEGPVVFECDWEVVLALERDIMTAVSCSGFLLLLCLLTAAECDLVVFATVGFNVTLPCNYDVTANGLSSTCWGRGAIPAWKCSNQLIAADGATVRKDSQVSSRYQLLGDLRKGDASMTILNVSAMDSGRYGCRVEIAGWWNDLKHHFKLSVQEDTKPTPKRTLDNVTSTEQTTLKFTQAHINSTRYWDPSETVLSPIQGSSGQFSVPIACVLIIASIAVVGVAVYFIKRSGKFSKSSQINSLSGPEPTNREENIYQMDEVNPYQTFQ
ncbi:hepatitis A virus cellular receptor 2 homolog isoform X2 [Gadus macrocephalus]|uniref:hepatitis A virus cellular receptor 2 homolog isoform X2 n=1 Tax=Gadus macrocephalus TaxID=80720 RepID=UPI0028CB5C78|nr:hepatitis A virus cellular receptor 2 homolog isoform X2 [Gadus macrocephalus]